MHSTVQGGRVAEVHVPAGVDVGEVWLGRLLVVVVGVVRVVVVRLGHTHEGVDAGGGRQQLDGEGRGRYSSPHGRSCAQGKGGRKGG